MAARKIGKLLLIIVWSIIFTTNVFMSKHSTSHSCARFLLHSPICFEVWEECYVTVCGHSFWYTQVLVNACCLTWVMGEGGGSQHGGEGVEYLKYLAACGRGDGVPGFLL